jgi:hypothetical protein
MKPRNSEEIKECIKNNSKLVLQNEICMARNKFERCNAKDDDEILRILSLINQLLGKIENK